ncbi:MAG: SDR family oxidoreductase [Bacteroidales bacterium]|nr:SDR family oxidoreductase [Bacteroidales bacterium]
MNIDLTGKTILVTGASRGIGRGIAEALGKSGATVAVHYRKNNELAETLAKEIGNDSRAFQADLEKPEDCNRLFEAVIATFGRLDVLVNNAGISPKGPDGERLNTLNTDLMDWGKVFHVNFFAPVVLARGLKDELAAARGSVVNVTSIAGVRVHPFAGAAYATSKAALAALTREMAHDFGPLGVRVNAIAPGEVETAILSPGTDKIVETLPLRRLGQPEEVAAAIYFLCSQDSSYISGTEIEVNGAQHV